MGNGKGRFSTKKYKRGTEGRFQGNEMGTGEMGILGNEMGSGEEGFSTNKTENKIGYGLGGGGDGVLGK